MTRSKDFEPSLNLDDLKLDDIIDTSDTITINLDDYNMASSSPYWAGDSVGDITFDTSTTDGTFTVDINSITDSTVGIDWIYDKINIDPNEVEQMCKEYPALEKVWRNFKSVYDMVKQDYEGKKKAGEIDDDIPF